LTEDGPWKALIEQVKATCRPPPLRAETYTGLFFQSDSKPVVLICSDKKEYVVKGRHRMRAIANEQLVARLARALGAPVPDTVFVDVPKALVDANPDMAHMPPGVSHGSLFQGKDCTERAWLERAELAKLPANRPRFAPLAVLYGWVHSVDNQLIYKKSPPEVVFSVDHGHFFPGGPAWTAQTLSQAARPEPLKDICAACDLGPGDLATALGALRQVDKVVIAEAVAMPPDDWQFDLDLRAAAAKYLYRRRGQLLGEIPVGG
jgi:hypothetical protein